VRAAPGCGTIAIRESDRPADAASHERYGDDPIARLWPDQVDVASVPEDGWIGPEIGDERGAQPAARETCSAVTVVLRSDSADAARRCFQR
jgi:hypothetical protein